MRIVLCYPVEQRHCKQIEAAMPEAEVVACEQEEINEALMTADIYCGHAKVPVDWDRVVKQGRLRWIQSSAAGMDHCLVPSVIASDITITSASAVLSDQVAEHTIGLLTAWYRSLPVFFKASQKREYIRRPTLDLHHRTVGICGFGGVGRRLAEVIRTFKTRILATDMFPVDKPDYVEALWPADRLAEMISEVDLLVLSLPLNEMTRGMFDANLLSNMKPDALLANMARGQLVVEKDLVAALESGRPAGAVLDVAEREPLPEDSKLWEMPNVIITPHVAGQSKWRIDNMTRMFCQNIERWKAGRPLINYLADKPLGFPIRNGKTPLWTDVLRET